MRTPRVPGLLPHFWRCGRVNLQDRRDIRALQQAFRRAFGATTVPGKFVAGGWTSIAVLEVPMDVFVSGFLRQDCCRCLVPLVPIAVSG